MNNLEASGVVILGGPLEGTPDVLLVIRADSAEAAAQHLQDDPWTALNLLVIEKVMPWTIRISALQGPRPGVSDLGLVHRETALSVLTREPEVEK